MKDPLHNLTLAQITYLRECARDSKHNFTDLRKKIVKDKRILDELLQHFPAWFDEFMSRAVDKERLAKIKRLHTARDFGALEEFGGFELCAQQIQEEAIREAIANEGRNAK